MAREVIVGDNMFDRLQLAITNAASRNPQGAWDSIYDPDKLSPKERETLAAKWGLTGPLAAVVNVSTNPVVLLGVAMTGAGALAGASRVMPLDKILPSMTTAGEAIMKWKPFNWARPYFMTYRGKDSKLAQMVPMYTNKFLSEFKGAQGTLKESYEAALQMKKAKWGPTASWTEKDDMMLGWFLEGRNSNKSPHWNKLIDTLRKDIDKGKGVGKKYKVTQAEFDEMLAAINKNGGMAEAVPDYVQKLAGDIRENLNLIWDKVNKHEHRDKIIEEMFRASHYHKGLKKQIPKDGLIAYIQEYLPRMAHMTPEERDIFNAHYLQSMLTVRKKAGGGRGIQAIERTSKAVSIQQRLDDIATKNFFTRTDVMIPHTEQMRELGISDPIIKVFDKVRHSFRDRKTGALPPMYDLRGTAAIHNYHTKFARTMAGQLPVVGATKGSGLEHGLIRGMMAEGYEMMGSSDRWVRAMGQDVLDTVIPLATNTLTVDQAISATKWAATRHAMVETLKTGALGKAIQKIAPTVHEKLIKWGTSSPRLSYHGLNSTMTGYLYHGALGANPFSAMQNAMQTFSGLAAVVPARDITAGMSKVFGAYSRAAAKYVRGGKKFSELIEEELPEFYRMHQELAPMHADDIMSQVDFFAEKTAIKGPFGKAGRALLDKMMTLFSGTELANRHIAFYSSRNYLQKELVGKTVKSINRNFEPVTLAKEAIKKGGDLEDLFEYELNANAAFMTALTQHGGGAVNRPQLTRNWASLASQFTTFPIRQLGLLSEVANPVTNPGGAGRLLLSAGAAYGLLQETLGVDMSRAVLFGGLPAPREYGVFKGVPVLPPAVQLAGAAGLAAVGQPEELMRSLPILVPGGLGLSRAIGAIPGLGRASQAVGRNRVDWSQLGEDGRAPVYNKDDTLIGYQSVFEILGSAMGVPSGHQETEKKLVQYVLGNRKYIADLKRKYTQAVYDNDSREQMRLATRWQRLMPGVSDVPVDKATMQALHRRQFVTRLERVMEQLPPDLRPDYQAIVSMALGTGGDEFLGVQGGFETGPTVGARDQFRRTRQAEISGRISQNLRRDDGPSLHGVKLRDKMRMAGIDPNAESALAAYGGSNFGGFGGFGNFRRTQ